MESFVGRQLKPGDGARISNKWVPLLPDDEDWNAWLPGLIDECLEKGIILGGVVENTHSPKRVAAFGMSVFISDQVHDEFFANPKPYLNARLLKRFKSGERSVFMAPEQQAAANRDDGLTMMVLEYFSENHNYDDPQAHAIGNRILPEYIRCHAGFNIKKNIHETEEALGFLQLAGGQQELLKFEKQHPYSMKPGGLGSRAVYGLSRDLRATFTVAGIPNIIMNYHRPILELMPKEQQAVLLAMEGLTDQAIANKLGISRDAIKQRWQSIYAQFELNEPDFFSSDDSAKNGSFRGGEKRRQVIASLSQRMEELRPYCLRRG